MDIFSLLDEVQTIARNGLHYADGSYDIERYERLLSIATQQYAALVDLPADAVKERFSAETGYITPKVGADAAIFNAVGQILLMERSDGLGWCLPCGWCEPNERPSDTAVREAFEETGLEVVVKQLVGVFTRMPNARTGPHTMVAIVHLCDVVGGELTLSHEGTDLRYWDIDANLDWHPKHDQYAKAAYSVWCENRPMPSISD